MEKIYNDISKKGIKLSLITPSKITQSKSIENINYNTRYLHCPHFHIKKADIKISKEKNSQDNDASIKYPSILLKNNKLKLFPKEKNQLNLPESKKVDASTQNDFSPIKSHKITRIKSNLLKNLLANYPQKNKNPINSVLESPHRGVEKIPCTTSFSKYNNCSPFYKTNTFRGCVYKKSHKRNISDINKNISFSRFNKEKEAMIDKYIKVNKKIDNPLKYLSKISGVSCYKLRQVIDYSLSCGAKYLEKNMIQNEQIESTNTKRLIENKKYKNIYSIITLKSKKKNEVIKDYSIELNNDASIDKVMSTKKFSNIKPIDDD